MAAIYSAPSDSKAPLNSLIAVLTSSKFKAEMAQRACFCALAKASSSATKWEAVDRCGGGKKGVTMAGFVRTVLG